MLTILGPEATTGFEYRDIVGRDRSAARELPSQSIGFAGLQWCQNGWAFDQSCRHGEHDEHHCCGPDELVAM